MIPASGGSNHRNTKQNLSRGKVLSVAKSLLILKQLEPRRKTIVDTYGWRVDSLLVYRLQPAKVQMALN